MGVSYLEDLEGNPPERDYKSRQLNRKSTKDH